MKWLTPPRFWLGLYVVVMALALALLAAGVRTRERRADDQRACAASGRLPVTLIDHTVLCVDR